MRTRSIEMQRNTHDPKPYFRSFVPAIYAKEDQLPCFEKIPMFYVFPRPCQIAKTPRYVSPCSTYSTATPKGSDPRDAVVARL